MDLNYTEEERAFQSEVRQFLADYLPKNIAAAVRAHDGLTKEMMDEWHAILNKKRLACHRLAQRLRRSGLEPRSETYF